MGLDMYLNKMPRYKDTSAHEVSVIENYLDWINDEENKSKFTLKEWCGIDENELPDMKVITYYTQFFNRKFSYWDTEHKYGYSRIFEQVGYWRKANQIHNWFVEKVQDGEDDCHYHNEITKDLLEELLETCNTVLESCVMINGQVENGKTVVDGELISLYEDGKVVIDSSVAEELLPTVDGFFFGGTDYNEYYVDDIVETIKIITHVLETTDFEKEAIYYVSSW